MASLSRPAPNGRFTSLSRPAPNGHFIKGSSQFVKASSNQKGRPLDLVLGGSIRYCAAQAVYQRPPGHGLQLRPPMASVSKPAPNGHFIKGFSQFVKASSNQKGRPLDLVLGGSIRYCAAQAVYQRPAGHGLHLKPPMASLSRPAPNGHFIKGFSKASSNQKGRPLDLVLGGPIRYCAAQAIYQRPAGHGLQSRPAPMASLARPVPMAPEGPTSRSSPWRVNPLLRRTSSLSISRPAPNGHFIKGFS